MTGQYLHGVAAGPAALPGETIAEGLDGEQSRTILRLLGSFVQTQDGTFLRKADAAIDGLIDHCQKNASPSYGLYTGRAGLVYVLLQRYLCRNDDRYIGEALRLIRPANGLFLYSGYTTDDLYEGRAGTLLVLIHLYLVTGAGFLMETIAGYITAILAHAEPCGDGLCWNSPQTGRLAGGCGFAHGAAGIRYVLLLFNAYCDCPVLTYVIEKAARYIGSCRTEHGQHGDGLIEIKNPHTLALYRKGCPETRSNPQTENILYPYGLPDPPVGKVIRLDLSLKDLRRRIVQKDYPRTMALLEAIASETAGAFLDANDPGSSRGETPAFMQTVEDWLSGHAHLTSAPRLADVFALEKRKFILAGSDKRSRLQRYLDDLDWNRKILGVLNEPEAALEERTLAIADGLEVIFTSWDWKYTIPGDYAGNEELKKKHLQNLQLAPGKFEYVLTPAADPKDMEPLNTDWNRLVLHLFDEPKTTASARGHLTRLARTITEERLMGLLRSLNIGALTSKAELLPWVNKMFLIRIRQFLHLGLLKTDL